MHYYVIKRTSDGHYLAFNGVYHWVNDRKYAIRFNIIKNAKTCAKRVGVVMKVKPKAKPAPAPTPAATPGQRWVITERSGMFWAGPVDDDWVCTMGDAYTWTDRGEAARMAEKMRSGGCDSWIIAYYEGAPQAHSRVVKKWVVAGTRGYYAGQDPANNNANLWAHNPVFAQLFEQRNNAAAQQYILGAGYSVVAVNLTIASVTDAEGKPLQ